MLSQNTLSGLKSPWHTLANKAFAGGPLLNVDLSRKDRKEFSSRLDVFIDDMEVKIKPLLNSMCGKSKNYWNDN